MIHTHEISVIADRFRIPGWIDYTISQDMLQPADAFSMSVRFTRDAWNLLQTDQEVTVAIDSTKILSGFVDQRGKVSQPGSGTLIQITGRDRGGRLVDESSPLFSYGGLGIKELAEKIVGITDDDDPLFESVVLENTRNRSLLRNVRARQAKVVKEPFDGVTGRFREVNRFVLAPHVELEGVSGTARNFGRAARGLKVVPQSPVVDPGIYRGRRAPKKVQPGSSRWAVLEMFLREARLLAWSTGDGRELVIGLPNYDQENQFYFYEPSITSANRSDATAAIDVTEKVTDRYSKITAVGAAKGSGASYGSNVTKNRGVVLDNPDDSDGVGRSFLRRKALIITDDSIKNSGDALERAEREQLERDSGGLEVVVKAPGHSQLYSGETPAIFTIDTMARVFDEDTGTEGDFLSTAVEYRQSRDEGTVSEMRLVPKGTYLQL
jgi:prophage tail gpP-like protein